MAFLLIASFFITSIIFNYINFVNCWLSDVYVPFFIADKLYYVRTNTIFYIDLVGVSLDNNTIVYASNWVNINVSKLNIDYLPKDSFLGGKANDKIFFVSNHSKELRLHAFDATLKKLEANISYQGVLNAYYNFDEINWISDEQTSKSYIYDTYVGGDANLTIFDSNNLAWINGTSNPQNLLQGILGSSQIIVSYHSFVQVLSASDKIFYIGGRISGSSFTIQFMPMKNILIYDIVSDSWLINNATGNEIEGRTGHTAVMTTDKRIIVYGGLNKLRPALPYLAVLDTSNIPYEWSAPTEENSIGPITEHSSIMIKNYMITAFGRNLSERDDAKYDIKDVYKLNISNPLSYKWSLLATPNNQSNSVDNNSSIFDSINTKTDGVSVFNQTP
ncbi:galactose oxidase [Gigaspora margarita]|uniref:Galactose oxidase n=1 Tax=Gigaspora margarita TaxID=4874 RepID=A0A8H3XEN8_GIGMA|nr:galactose oxidase [Gigaspora margarita]